MVGPAGGPALGLASPGAPACVFGAAADPRGCGRPASPEPADAEGDGGLAGSPARPAGGLNASLGAARSETPSEVLEPLPLGPAESTGPRATAAGHTIPRASHSARNAMSPDLHSAEPTEEPPRNVRAAGILRSALLRKPAKRSQIANFRRRAISPPLPSQRYSRRAPRGGGPHHQPTCGLARRTPSSSRSCPQSGRAEIRGPPRAADAERPDPTQSYRDAAGLWTERMERTNTI
jgi:hypothetical protein